jgi:heme exporter protein CcmD
MSSSFWEMGGYAAYVWGSYGVAAMVFAWNLIAPRLRRRKILKELSTTE